MYREDDKNPLAARAIARRELPNLMQAVKRAIAAADPDAVDVGDNVNKFLDYFGLGQDRAVLTQKLEALQGEARLARLVSKPAATRGRRCEAQSAMAMALFTEILQGLGEAPSYEQCLTLGRIGRCLEAQGQAAQAAECYRAGIGWQSS